MRAYHLKASMVFEAESLAQAASILAAHLTEVSTAFANDDVQFIDMQELENGDTINLGPKVTPLPNALGDIAMHRFEGKDGHHACACERGQR